MTLQDYYQLQAKLQALDNAHSAMSTALYEANNIFNLIDPNQLLGAAVATPPAQSGTTTTFPPPALSPSTPVPVANPKQRPKLGTPVLTGPLKDQVEDMLAEKAAAAEEAAKPKRIAPYEVLVKGVTYRDMTNEYWASVFDKKYNEETLVPISKSTYDEFNRDPDGLAIDLDSNTLDKTEWFPVKKEETLQSWTQSSDPDVSLMAQAAADGFKQLGIDPNDIVFVDDPNVEEEE